MVLTIPYTMWKWWGMGIMQSDYVIMMLNHKENFGCMMIRFKKLTKVR